MFESNETTLHCDKCYLKFVDKCSKCGQNIVDQVITVVDTAEKYHHQCFRCEKCSRPLESCYFEHQGVRYCRDDYLITTTTICDKCLQPIHQQSSTSTNDYHGQLIQFQSKNYHLDCFVCDGCETGFDSCVIKSNINSSKSSKQVGKENNNNNNNKISGESGESLKGHAIQSSGGIEEMEEKNNSNKIKKIYYSMNGQKLCKKCAYVKHKQKQYKTTSSKSRYQY